jgi:NADH-quinone oxidoreductase subunit N
LNLPSPSDLLPLLPVAILALGGLVLLVGEVVVAATRAYQAWLTVAFALAAGAAALLSPTGHAAFAGQLAADAFSAFIIAIVCGSLALSALVGAAWLQPRGAERGEFYALALFAASGMGLLAMAADLLVAFIAIEVMGISTYALAAYIRRGRRPAEASFKYFLMGAFSSALFLYGTALIYGTTGSTRIVDILAGHSAPLLVAGLALVASGLAFKVAAVPFHLWTPDVYEGAPTPVTAFMAAGVKAAAFAVLVRVALASYAGASVASAGGFPGVLAALAVLSMLFGNLLALPQRSVKRMLAYSSIAHAGYLLVAVVTMAAAEAREDSLSGLLFYLTTYAVAAIGSFAVVGVLERQESPGEEPVGAWDLDRFAGLHRRHPVLALVMTLFLVSLAGIPPTAGFIGKLLIFKTAVGVKVYGLAVLGVLSSVLGAYYYLRVVVYMIMREPVGAAEPPARLAPGMGLALAAAAVVVAWLGVGPQALADIARSASSLNP